MLKTSSRAPNYKTWTWDPFSTHFSKKCLKFFAEFMFLELLAKRENQVKKTSQVLSDMQSLLGVGSVDIRIEKLASKSLSQQVLFSVRLLGWLDFATFYTSFELQSHFKKKIK